MKDRFTHTKLETNLFIMTGINDHISNENSASDLTSKDYYFDSYAHFGIHEVCNIHDYKAYNNNHLGNAQRYRENMQL